MGNLLDILYVPMGYLIRFAYSITNNYLLAIILFALVIEIILSPIQVKQQKTQIKQAKLQPKINVIRKKYAGRNDNVSKQKMNEEVMEVYRKEGFNPAGGCLPLLIQFPVIICLYQVIINPLRYISGLSKDAVTALVDAFGQKGIDIGTGQQMQINIINHLRDNGTGDFVSAVPEIENAVLPVFKIGPFDLSQTPSLSNINYLIIIPILVFLAMWGSMIIMRKFTYQAPEQQDAQNSLSMKIMNLTMPLMSTWISFSVPASIGIYWIFRNILSVVERFIISRLFPIPQISPEEMKAAEHEYGGKAAKKKEDRPKVRSLHRIDEDDDELPPPVIDKEEEEEEITEKKDVAAGASVIEKAPLKDGGSDGEKKKKKRK